jgi:streptogramin lyase
MRHRHSRTGSAALAAVLGMTALAALTAAAPAASADTGGLTEAALPVADVAPVGIAAGADGGAWYAANAGGIGHVDAKGKVTEYAVPDNSQKLAGIPDGMATGSDGTVWFTDLSGAVPRVGRVDTATGKSTLYELPTTGTVNFADAQVSDIAAGQNGTMWFTGGYSGTLGRIDPSGNVTAYATGLAPATVTLGPDQAVWFTDKFGSIGRLDPATGAVTSYSTPSGGNGSPALGGIVTGPDGRLWFTEPGVSKVGSIDPATHEIQEYGTPIPDSRPFGIATGKDGKLWVTESATSNVASVDPVNGGMQEYGLPKTLSAPAAITAAPGGDLWITEPGRGLIGRFDPSAPPSAYPNPAVPAFSPGAYPNGAAAFMNRCPAGQICQTQVTTGGTVTIGSFKQTLPAGAIRISGYLGAADETGDPLLVPPVTGQQLDSAPVDVPGGLIGQLPLVGPILGQSPAAMWDVNKLTVTQTLNGPVHVSLSGGGFGAKASLNIHLNNQLLGSSCVIGPLDASLSPAFTAGTPTFDDAISWIAGQVSIDAPVAVPAAKGCGPFGILDGVINQMMGLPSPASKNSMSLTGVLSLATGINQSNVPEGLAPSATAKAKASSLLKKARAAKKPARVAKAPKKVTVRLKARH